MDNPTFSPHGETNFISQYNYAAEKLKGLGCHVVSGSVVRDTHYIHTGNGAGEDHNILHMARGMAIPYRHPMGGSRRWFWLFLPHGNVTLKEDCDTITRANAYAIESCEEMISKEVATRMMTEDGGGQP